MRSLTGSKVLQNFTFSQVRNAINALQELATTSNTVANTNRFPFPLPAHSNPNLGRGNDMNVTLPRSSSHPPDMFCWEDDDTPEKKSTEAETQTEIPLEYFRQFVLDNQQMVLEWLNRQTSVTSVCETEQTKPPDWLTNPLPPPAYWNTQHHRFSAGDAVERTSRQTSQTLTSSRSLKFHPYS